jgi:glyceraldehyde-3-phosphate dehydrogenase/erythrose-4-phosphate dehydrogenase
MENKETLKEAAENWGDKFYGEYDDIREYMASAFVKGAKWQANQNQEAINKLISIIEWYDDESDVRPDAETFMWFEQFKKK